MLEKEDFKPTDLSVALGEESPPEVVVEPQPQPEAVKEAESTAPEAPQDAPKEPEKVQEAQPPVNDGSMPYGAYAAEKDKRQEWQNKYTELEKTTAEETARLNARIQAFEYQQQQSQKPVEVPDVFSDTEAYTQHVQQQALAPVMPVINSLQRQLAGQVHGKDKVDAANTWFDTLQPQHRAALMQAYANDPDPYGKLVQEHSKAQIAESLSDPTQLEAFKAWQAQQNGQAQPNTAPSPDPTPVTAQPAPQQQFAPSLAGKTSMTARSGPSWPGPTPLENVLPE